jgi:mono/diheme cytochrome c family protein
MSRQALGRGPRQHFGARCARDGSHLFPAFPYDHFAKLTDDDISALYAYLMSRPPVSAKAPANTLPFPLSIRALQAGWKLLYFHSDSLEPRPDKTAEWNRGAYLAEGIGHCGACHTPRNSVGAEEKNNAYAGAEIDGWIAPPLDRSNPSRVPWDIAELTAYLGAGVSQYHGVANGPMAPVARGISRLPRSDIQAIATYFNDKYGVPANPSASSSIIAEALSRSRIGTGSTPNSAAKLYGVACASCHYNGAGKINPMRPELALTSAVNLDDPSNLIQVMLHGVSAEDGASRVVMPAFARFSDTDLSKLASFLRATRTNKAPWQDLEKKIAAIRAAGNGSERVND